MRKENCWEFKKCGRETGGAHAHEFGICPASIENSLDGIHGGINGGRCCWVLAYTLCSSGCQRTFAQKFKDCIICDFYKKVKKEELYKFRHAVDLIHDFKVKQ
jgi:hypothetical protein